MNLYLEDGDRMNAFNHESENIFFSYCYCYNTTLNERIIPMTTIKQEMIIYSSPNPVKFIHSMTEYVQR